MSREHIGRTVVLEPDKIYLILSESSDKDVNFSVVDTLDYDQEDHRLLACLARGLIEFALKKPDDATELGLKAFEKDNVKINDTQLELTLDGFPKTIGNA